jgi:hypothetical protein
MSYSINLPDKLFAEVRRYASVSGRSVPEQIEYWSHIGKITEENPDLPYGFIKQLLISKQEADEGELADYHFG